MVTRVVADASVAIKWLLPLQPDEADVEHALRLNNCKSAASCRFSLVLICSKDLTVSCE